MAYNVGDSLVLQGLFEQVHLATTDSRQALGPIGPIRRPDPPLSCDFMCGYRVPTPPVVPGTHPLRLKYRARGRKVRLLFGAYNQISHREKRVLGTHPTSSALVTDSALSPVEC